MTKTQWLSHKARTSGEFWVKVKPYIREIESEEGLLTYIQQVFWAKKYLPRKNEGFRDSILNSKFFIEYYSQLSDLKMSLKKAGKLQDVLFVRISLINTESQKTPAECRL